MNQSAQTPPVSRRWFESLDRELVAVARSAGAMRLAMGAALRRLREPGGYLELGFSSLGAYAFERLGRKRRWAEESARVATRLAELPRLRAALEQGELGWSMVELLARHATPEDEAELATLARTETVRAMRERLAVSRDGDEAREPEVGRRTLQVSVARETSWAWELTRSLIRMRFGAADDDAVLEALLAEGASTLLGRHPELAGHLTASAQRQAEDGVRELERRLAELNAEDVFGRRGEDPALIALIAAWTEGARPAGLPRDPTALDAHLRRANTALQTRDRRLGALARELWQAGGWRELGYASASQYANERLGCSLASVKARMTLARRCEHLPEITRALADGELSFEAARVVSRVATRDTVAGWLERASARTVEHLREEVDIVEACARAEGRNPVGVRPPSDALVAEVQALERGMLDGSIADLLSNGGRLPESSQKSDDKNEVKTGQMSVDALRRGRGAGLVPLRMRLSEEMVTYWKDVRRLFAASDEAGDFVDFLIRTFWRVWLRRAPDEVAYMDVYERERFRCASPVCRNRDLTPHHLRFRSRGGGDERSNLAALCVTCHLELLHQGRMKAEAPAHDTRWTLGRSPLLTVHGRTVVRG